MKRRWMLAQDTLDLLVSRAKDQEKIPETLQRASMEAVLEQLSLSYDHCWDLEGAPLMMHSSVRVRVAPTGRVEKVTKGGYDVSEDFVSCVGDVLGTLEFPASKRGSPRINLSIELSREKTEAMVEVWKRKREQAARLE